MLFNDRYGYRIDGVDVEHIDIYARNRDGHPCVFDNKFNADIE